MSAPGSGEQGVRVWMHTGHIDDDGPVQIRTEHYMRGQNPEAYGWERAVVLPLSAAAQQERRELVAQAINEFAIGASTRPLGAPWPDPYEDADAVLAALGLEDA